VGGCPASTTTRPYRPSDPKERRRRLTEDSGAYRGRDRRHRPRTRLDEATVHLNANSVTARGPRPRPVFTYFTYEAGLVRPAGSRLDPSNAADRWRGVDMYLRFFCRLCVG
jgi:hypothetical protein